MDDDGTSFSLYECIFFLNFPPFCKSTFNFHSHRGFAETCAVHFLGVLIYQCVPTPMSFHNKTCIRSAMESVIVG